MRPSVTINPLISETIKTARVSHELSQRGFAKLLHLSAMSISAWEHRRTQPTAERARLLAKEAPEEWVRELFGEVVVLQNTPVLPIAPCTQ